MPQTSLWLHNLTYKVVLRSLFPLSFCTLFCIWWCFYQHHHLWTFNFKWRLQVNEKFEGSLDHSRLKMLVIIFKISAEYDETLKNINKRFGEIFITNTLQYCKKCHSRIISNHTCSFKLKGCVVKKINFLRFLMTDITFQNKTLNINSIREVGVNFKSTL